MIEGHATSRYIRTSAQKAKLVLDQIRGRDVTHALAALKFSPKMIARDIEKVLRSAIANAQQQEGFSGDVERLFVAQAWAGQGPSMKRIRPAPMGRAFRVVKRTAHLTVGVSERPEKVAATPARTKTTKGATTPAADPVAKGKTKRTQSAGKGKAE